MIDAEVRFQENVTERWKADMGSDVKLAKLIRPVTLICLMAMFMITMMIDSMDNVAFNVKDSYVSLLELLMFCATALFEIDHHKKWLIGLSAQCVFTFRECVLGFVVT